MMLLDPPFERQHQIVPLMAELPSGKVRHRLGRGAALDQSLQHGAPGNPEDVAGDAGQLDVGRLQELQEPVALGRLAFHQFAAIAQQLAQLALRRRRDEALGDQPMADQIGDPLGVLHIGLATRHVTDMPGVADDEVEMPFQHGIDRAPVNAGALHADLRHPMLSQPVPQCLQIARLRAELRTSFLGPLLAADRARRRRPSPVYVQPTTPLNDHLHPRLHPGEGDRDAAGIVETLPCVLPVPGGDKEWYLYAARAGLPIGVASHRSIVSLTRSPVAKAPKNRPAPPPFSSIMARRRRWLAA